MSCCFITDQIIDILSRVVNSQLFSTALGLVLGSYVITRFHATRERNCDSLRAVMKSVDEYVQLGYEYWKYNGERSVKRKIISARLKTEGFFLDAAVRSIPKVRDDQKLLLYISELWEAATGGCFEADDEIQKASMDKNISAIAKAAKNLKANLFNHLNKY